MLLVWDLYQLPPVMQCPIFQQPSIRRPGDMAQSSWHTFILHELKQIMCQQDTNFSNMLNVIWMKQPEENSLEDLMLKSCGLSNNHNHKECHACVCHKC